MGGLLVPHVGYISEDAPCFSYEPNSPFYAALPIGEVQVGTFMTEDLWRRPELRDYAHEPVRATNSTLMLS